MQIAEFQSTLPRGERPLCGSLAPVFQDFNPRSREGSDNFPTESHLVLSNFNPRSREGSDVSGSTISFPSYRFQSTLPRGERPEPDTACYPDQHNFNPRSREGSDIFYGVPAFRGVLFQSTLPRGERRHIGVNVLFHDLFQSTLPRGERPREIHPHQSEHNFNPRSREGSDELTAAAVMCSQHFNPRSREGSDNCRT